MALNNAKLFNMAIYDAWWLFQESVRHDDVTAGLEYVMLRYVESYQILTLVHAMN